jgi:hypothetical protein
MHQENGFLCANLDTPLLCSVEASDREALLHLILGEFVWQIARFFSFCCIFLENLLWRFSTSRFSIV